MKTRKAFILLLLLLSLCTVSVCAADFRDVPADAWYAESVRFVSEKGIMGGTGEHTFDPDGNITRGMIVTVLYRMEGAPAVSGASAFTDVIRGAYYEKAVTWAAGNSIVNGYSTTQFGPNDSITREQLAAILYRYCANKQGDISAKGELNQYKDAGEISSYAKTAMRWANENGLITGTSATTLSPKGTATRAQAAAIIMRCVENTAAAQRTGGSSDVPTPPVREPSAGDRSAQPVLRTETVSAHAGERVSVDVAITNNPGILGMTLTVSYDEQSMKLVRAESGTAVNGVLTFVPARALKSGSGFVWYGTKLSEEQVKDGTVLTLTFELSDRAEGMLPITLTAVSGDIIDKDLRSVDVQLQSGGIEVK